MSEKRFVSPQPVPVGHNRELLTVFIEECAETIKELSEAQQRASKTLRFGLSEVQPGQEDTNVRRLGLEIGDVETMIARLLDAGIVSATDIAEGRIRKNKQLAKFMQSQ